MFTDSVVLDAECGGDPGRGQFRILAVGLGLERANDTVDQRLDE